MGIFYPKNTFDFSNEKYRPRQPLKGIHKIIINILPNSLGQSCAGYLLQKLDN